MVFSDEHAFSAAIVQHLKKENYFVTRIESHTTPGIPDIYAVNEKGPIWIELKFHPKKAKFPMKVKWRPGQQFWAYNHWAKDPSVRVVTLIACTDGILCVPMNRPFMGSVIHEEDVSNTWENVTIACMSL